MKIKFKDKTLTLYCIGILVLLLGICSFALSCSSAEENEGFNPSATSTHSIVSSVSESKSSEDVVTPQSVLNETVDQSTFTQEVKGAESQEIQSQTSSTTDTNNYSQEVAVQSMSTLQTQTSEQSEVSTPPIKEGEIVYANPKSIQEPKESDFGEWYDYALDIYGQFIAGTVQENQDYYFPYNAEIHPWDKSVKDFFATFQEKCLTGLDIDVAYHQYLDNTNGETRIRIQLDQSSISQYQDIVYVQNTIQSIVGNAVSERTVIDRITDWCIQNCQYNSDYQFNGEYRDVNTVVKNLLQTQKGICDDFAQLVSYTCDLYGIPCEYIASPNDGRSTAKRHAWNRVCIGGTWYYIDVTWSVYAEYNAYPLSETLWENHEQYL